MAKKREIATDDLSEKMMPCGIMRGNKKENNEFKHQHPKNM